MGANWIEQFHHEGYCCFSKFVSHETCAILAAAVEPGDRLEPLQGRAGRRDLLRSCDIVREIAQSTPVREVVDVALNAAAGCVRAIWFDKTPAANWLVPWHQDVVIAVSEPCEFAGFHGWSLKRGTPHCVPPADVLAGMVAVRIHVDDCYVENGPLRVLPGSHREGVLDQRRINRLAAQASAVICNAPRGGGLLMRPLLLHASSRAVCPSRRRVLHLEYAAGPLPSPLKWYDWV